MRKQVDKIKDSQEIEELEDRVQELESEVSDLERQVENLETQVEELESNSMSDNITTPSGAISYDVDGSLTLEQIMESLRNHISDHGEQSAMHVLDNYYK